MIAIKTRFDGKQVILPPDRLHELTPGEVIVIGDASSTTVDGDRQAWLKVQEEALAHVWNNDADAVYDSL